jgi:serine/threonine protein kinase
MIVVTCPHDLVTFKVKGELAGKRIRCPSCKSPILVPAPHEDATLAPPASHDSDSATLPPPASVGETMARPPASGLPGVRFETRGRIGRGGMGEVVRVEDKEIGREVAVKYLLNQADAGQKARFVEEARITGRLEHPNIVPVHDAGIDGEGRLFFSMKMVKGRSLAEILDGLRKDDPEAVKDLTLARLLEVLLGVGNALAYAHSKKVIHRDLKPANVMVGGFGEVYVMDWGLAKVIGAREEVRRGAPTRASDAGMTQDGAVIGTPAYMPPEQAAGRVADLDQRSDIYSLGAILYEMLTLLPPTGPERDTMAILVKAAEGDIEAPERQAPQRARLGLIPPELSAVAMKALARNPADRYQSVEAMQADIRLYLEGRSVSARRDSAWELLTKLVKRNKGASIATAAAALVLAGVVGVAMWVNFNERVKAQKARDDAEEQRQKAEDNYKGYLAEQMARRRQMKGSVPALLEAARFSVERRRFPEALAQARVAVDYDPENADALLLRASLLLAEKDFAAALTDLEALLKLRLGDAEAQKLLALAREARADDSRTYAGLSDFFLARGEVVLASHMAGTRDAQLKLYQKLINAKWPRAAAEKNLRMGRDGGLSFDLIEAVDAEDLDPLLGIPLTGLAVRDRQGHNKRRLRDIKAVRGMPLRSLHIAGCTKLTDFTPLSGLPLTSLALINAGEIKDLSFLKGMKLTGLHIEKMFPSQGAIPPGDVGILADMPLRSLALGGQRTLRDLSFMKGLPLTHLRLSYTQDPVGSLAPLRGKKMKSLTMNATAVRDLGPLAEVELEELHLDDNHRLSDLKPLAKVKSLRVLEIGRCPAIKDISPLSGLKLEVIRLDPGRFPPEQMKVLREMESLKTIGISNQGTAQWGPAAFWKKYDNGDFGKK